MPKVSVVGSRCQVSREEQKFLQVGKTGALEQRHRNGLNDSMDSMLDIGANADVSGSSHSTPNTSPSGSLSRGQEDLMDAQGTPSVYSHLDTLYRQNEQQRAILAELFTGLGLKPGSLPASAPSSTGSKGQVVTSDSSIAGASTMAAIISGLDSVHRQELLQGQGGFEKQLQVTVRENESLRRENEALKRELDRLRRGP